MIFFSACLVVRLLNSQSVPLPVVQTYIFLKTVFTESSSLDCTLLPYTIFTGIKTGKISLTSREMPKETSRYHQEVPNILPPRFRFLCALGVK